MTPSRRTLTLDDGRALDVLTGGTPDGPALLCHHGTPGDAELWHSWDEDARRSGLQLIAMTRPGYGTSSRQPGRTVASVADDVRFVLDRLAAPWFVTAGWSGGGPHALACAALLPDRCRGVATLAGVAPFDAPGLDFLDGMGPENIAEFGATLEGEDAVRALLEREHEATRTVTGDDLIAALGGLVPDVDKAALRDGAADDLAASFRRALAPGFDGQVDDDLAFARPWGFALERIVAPVTVWQGDLDLMVPFAHGRWLAANVPGATARLVPGHGHISLMEYRDAIVADLVSGAERPPPG